MSTSLTRQRVARRCYLHTVSVHALHVMHDEVTNSLAGSKFNALVTNYNDDQQVMQYGKEGMPEEVMPRVSSKQ